MVREQSARDMRRDRDLGRRGRGAVDVPPMPTDARGDEIGRLFLTVEQVLLQQSLSRPPKPYLRVRHGTYFVADCASIEEVAQLVDLAR